MHIEQKAANNVDNRMPLGRQSPVRPCRKVGREQKGHGGGERQQTPHDLNPSLFVFWRFGRRGKSTLYHFVQPAVTMTCNVLLALTNREGALVQSASLHAQKNAKMAAYGRTNHVPCHVNLLCPMWLKTYATVVGAMLHLLFMRLASVHGPHPKTDFENTR